MYLTGRGHDSPILLFPSKHAKGQLTGFESLRDIVNIAKIHWHYSWDDRGSCSDKKDGIFLSVYLFTEKQTNQHQTLHLDPQQAGFMVHRNRISVMVVPNCVNIPK